MKEEWLNLCFNLNYKPLVYNPVSEYTPGFDFYLLSFS